MRSRRKCCGIWRAWRLTGPGPAKNSTLWPPMCGGLFAQEDIYVDREQLGHYLGLVKYFPYGRLFPWEEFLLTLWGLHL